MTARALRWGLAGWLASVAFGAPGHLRLSYATSLEAIEEAVTRMKRAVLKL